MGNKLIFANEIESSKEDIKKDNWKIMIVDDEEQVHAMTSIILREIVYEDKGIELISAYSGREAKELITKHTDTAVILLDVVMETESAGLDVARYIRKEVGNKMVRIILRTGQPGQAPERKVITEYDINDYKEKTELRSQKLYTTIIASLRSYRDINVIEQNRRGLKKIIEASRTIYKTQSLKKFASGVLIQLASFLHINDALLYASGGVAILHDSQNYKVIAGVGRYEDAVDMQVASLPNKVIEKLKQAEANKEDLFLEDEFIGYYETSGGNVNLLYIAGSNKLTSLDRKLLNVFSLNIGAALENIHLREIEKQNEELLKQAQKMETIGTLAGGIAHDFNNVLTAVFGAVGMVNFEFFEDRKTSLDEVMPYINTIEISAHRAADMVKQLMTLSRRNKLQVAPLDLVGAVKHVLKMSRSFFDKSIEYEVTFSHDTAVVMGDPTQIEQIILNICINAAHAMTIMKPSDAVQGGTLSISVESVYADAVFISTHPEAILGNYWKLSIVDQGIGMAPETIKQIFNPFFTKKEGKGTGLGLAMVYNIMKQHSGFIIVNSSVGKGSTFDLHFPAKQDDCISINSEESSGNVVKGRGKVMLVEDEELIAVMAKGILEKCEYEVEMYADGIAAVQAYQQDPQAYDVVVLDAAMPKLSGKETLLKLLEINPLVKVIFTSARNPKEVKYALQMGAKGLLQKPYSMRELSKKVSEVILQ